MVEENKRILLSPPDVSDAEREAVLRAVESGWLSPVGPELDAFEQEIAAYVGVQNAVAVSSGTAALHLCLKAVGVRSGDVIITSTMTFIATVNAIRYEGGIPVFVDSLLDGTIDPALVEEAINDAQSAGRRVGALLPVDIYGRSSDYERLLPIAAKHEIPVLCDAAEALGATHLGKMAGSFGDCAALSFNGNKIMTTSGGGMFLSSSAEAAEYVRYLSTQAKKPAVHYEHDEVGYNYRMSNVLAAIGRAQLTRLPEMISRRREIRLQYAYFFENIDGVELLPGNIEEDNCWLTSILVDSKRTGWSALDLRAFLDMNNIESRPLWKPMHMQPVNVGLKFFGENRAEQIFETGLALPSGSSLTDPDLEQIFEIFRRFLNGHTAV